MRQKIYIAGVWGTGNINIMEQFQNDDEVEFLKDDFRYFKQFRKIWRMINLRLGGHGKGIIRWLLRKRFLDRKYALSHCDFDCNEKNYIVIFNSALLHYYSKEYFERLRKKHINLKCILYIIDPMPDGLWPEIENIIEVFDQVMTMHPYNCRKYGFQYLPYAYAKPQKITNVSNIKHIKLFYCGVVDEYRHEIISEFIKKCEENHINFDFWIKPYENSHIKHDHVHYAEIPYDENIQRLEASDCILEIMHEGYVGITQRYLEAIIYNKRLISNNSEITELPYYNSQYMYYFEKIDDIDWEWVRKDVKVDYHYEGDFSLQRWKKKLLDLSAGLCEA